MPEVPVLGEIYFSGFNFAPRGYALCDGQTMAISQNQALFALLGTAFGGDGVQTFKLPDLRGRAPLGSGQGPGLTLRNLGDAAGEESTALSTAQIPAHNHTLNALPGPGNASAPQGAYLANTGALDREYATTGTPVAMNGAAIANTGGNLPHNNMPPYLVLTCYIALEGIFPSRN